MNICSVKCEHLPSVPIWEQKKYLLMCFSLTTLITSIHDTYKLETYKYNMKHTNFLKSCSYKQSVLCSHVETFSKLDIKKQEL